MKNLPNLGVGLGFRYELRPDIFLNGTCIDFLEITADHYFDAAPQKLEELSLLRDHFPLVAHSLDLSLGSAEGLKARYIEKLAKIVESIDPPWISDHIAFTRSGGVDIGHLAPVPFTREAVTVITRNIKELRREIDRPLILENITSNITYPSSELTEAAFVSRVLNESDCGMLLDVTNLYINSKNLGYDWRKFLDEVPLHRVVQIHFVGSRCHGGRLVDAHGDRTQNEIWEVFREVCARCDIKGAVLERDEDFPPFSEIIEELATARSIVASSAVERDQTSHVLS